MPVAFVLTLGIHAKLGETFPQLLHRFGSNDKAEAVDANQSIYEFAVGTFDVDAAVNHG